MIVILDNIRSVLNVGSIFRTADALGAEKVYLIGITPTPIDRFGKIRQDFHKTALGAEESVKWEKFETAEDLIKKLKKEGYTIIAVEQDERSTPYYKLPLKNFPLKSTALVMGNELRGVSEEVIKKADVIIDIPMKGIKESLNVAVSFAIVAFHFFYYE